MSTNRRALMIALACVGLVLVACSSGAKSSGPATAAPAGAPATPTPKPREITFMAGFQPQANLPFVAAYVADAKGFFAEEGLKVDIQHSSGADEHLKLLLAGTVDFTTGTAAQVLRRREDGLPTVAIALFGQRGDQAYVTRADSGIKTPADLKGRSVGFKSGVVPAELEAMLATAGLTKNDVKLQSVGFDPRAFIQGQVEVYPVFLDNEPDTIRRAGLAINVIDPADFGVSTLGVTYLARDDTLKNDPELARRFVRATLRATAWTQEHVDEAVQITLRWAKGADAEHQKFLLTTDLANARRAGGIGRADAKQWQDLQAMLRRYGVLTKDFDAGGAFNGTFVDEVYRSGVGSAQATPTGTAAGR